MLYGQAQPGGFINLITKKPQGRYQTTATLRADTYDGDGISFGKKMAIPGSWIRPIR